MATKRMASLTTQIETYLRLTDKPKPLNLSYASTSSWPSRTVTYDEPHIDVGVLDSSFNPPQAAHFALVKSKKPTSIQSFNGKANYDAILLLFSVKNADKGTGTEKDASAVQRLQMMELMARDLEREANSNVAVGMVEEPLMYSKSTLIHDYVRKKSDGKAKVRLHWLVGFDTLERFFQVKYYPSPEFFAEACRTFFQKEGTTFVCARRGLESQPNKKAQDYSQAQVERHLLQSELVEPWVKEGSVMMVDLDHEVQSVSSTAVRQLLTEKLSQEGLIEKLSGMTTPSVAKYLSDPANKVYRKS